MKNQRKSEIDRFIDLPDAARSRIFDEIERQSPSKRLAESVPLSAAERRRWKRFRGKVGRPRIGKGVKTVSLTVEKDLLKAADQYARKHGMSRAKLVAEGLRAIIGSAA